jgi:hypothetical protein
MTTTPAQRSQLRSRRDDLRRALAQVGDLRPGSLVERYRRCGKPTCHCAQPGDRGHGPSWSLTREVAGKTVTTVIPEAAVAPTRAHVAEYHRFRGLVRDFLDASEQWCDADVRATTAPADAGAEKGGSRRRSLPKSRARSRR